MNGVIRAPDREPTGRDAGWRLEEEGPGVPANWGGGIVMPPARADPERPRVGEVLLRGRPRPLPVPQAHLHRPRLPPRGLHQVQIHLRVRHRG